MLTKALLKALDDLFIDGMSGLFFKLLLATAAALALFITLVGIVLHQTVLTSITWLEPILDFMGTAGSAVIAYFLFPVLMPLVVSLFDEHIAEKIERADYPDAPEAQPQPFWQDISTEALFAVKALGLNLLCLPLYLIPLVNVFVYYSLNGYLLGREYFLIGAGRHMGRKQALALARTERARLFYTGLTLALLATIPVANLLLPFWGVALMVHLYQQMRLAGKIPAQAQ